MTYKHPTETPYIEVLTKKFCPWCLSEMKHDEWYEDSYYHCEVAYCDCDSAQKYTKLDNELLAANKALEDHKHSGYLYLEASDYNKFKIWELTKKIEIISNELQRFKLSEESNKVRNGFI